MHQYNVGAPFERIAIGIAGSFPESDNGNRYLLIAMDYFKKWPEVCAIPNQEASTVADALVTILLPLLRPYGDAQRPGPEIRIQANAGSPGKSKDQQN
jgi:hypothetical protein